MRDFSNNNNTNKQSQQKQMRKFAILSLSLSLFILAAWIAFNEIFLFNLFIYPYGLPFYWMATFFFLPFSFSLFVSGIYCMKNSNKEVYQMPTKGIIFLVTSILVLGLILSLFNGIDMMILNWVKIASDMGFEGAIAGWAVLGLSGILLPVLINEYTSIFRKHRSLKQNKQKLLKIAKKQTKALFITLMILISGIGVLYIAGCGRFYLGDSEFSDPAYDLPSGNHFNSDLDSLNAEDSAYLESLELSLWRFTQLQRAGGYPLGASADGTLAWGDDGKTLPLFPNEFSIQDGTAFVGEAYLKMYQLESNPVYLNMAEEIADALLSVQDETNGGFSKYGMRYEDGTGYQPHPQI